MGEPQEPQGGHRIAGGRRLVVRVFVAGDEGFVVFAGVEKAAAALVPEEVDHRFGQADCFRQPTRLKGPFVERHETVNHVRIIFEVAIELGFHAREGRAEQASFGRSQTRQNEAQAAQRATSEQSAPLSVLRRGRTRQSSGRSTRSIFFHRGRAKCVWIVPPGVSPCRWQHEAKLNNKRLCRCPPRSIYPRRTGNAA